MKKVLLVVLIILCVIGTMYMVKFSWSCIKNEAIDFIFDQLDKEEQIRQEKIANGELVRGKDTVLIWGNMYEIWKHVGDKILSVETDGHIGNILEHVTEYEKKGDKLYVIAEDGYAVIDKNNLCKVYWSSPEKELPEYNSSKGTIERLSSFDEFTENEQKMFRKMR